MADRLKVMVTGATGKIGQTLMEDLPDCFDLTGTSRSPNDDPRFIQLDFDDVDTVARAFAGQDVVVHMSAKSNHNTDEFEPYLQPNIVGLWNAYEAARLAGVRRFIYASSNHATGWYEIVGERCDAESLPRPDGVYGAAKVWGEALGRYFSDRHGMEVIVLRIGSYEYRLKPPEFSMGPPHPLHLAQRSRPAQPRGTVHRRPRHQIRDLLRHLGQRPRLLGHHQRGQRTWIPPGRQRRGICGRGAAQGRRLFAVGLRSPRNDLMRRLVGPDRAAFQTSTDGGV